MNVLDLVPDTMKDLNRGHLMVIMCTQSGAPPGVQFISSNFARATFRIFIVIERGHSGEWFVDYMTTEGNVRLYKQDFAKDWSL